MEHNHVFISYAHLDNKPLPQSPKGWISYFDEALTNLLSQKLGDDAKVWRDPRMARAAKFDDEIFDKLAKSLTLVSVVSPRYVKSPYCLDELEKFRVKITPIGTNSRVFKVVKTAVKLEEMPEFFREINGFDFFKIDEETKKPRELGLEYGPTLREEFFLRVSDLAYEIAELLKLIPPAAAERAGTVTDKDVPVAVSKGKTVYLAETSVDFQKERANIRRDLLDRGYQVLPAVDVVVPATTDEYTQFVRENIQKSDLSVHLIGKNYGERPEDGEQSYIHIQAIVGAERDIEPDFTRIVWLPKELNVAQPRHQEFVNEIWASTALGVEVVQKPLEELKTNILDALDRAPTPPPQARSLTAKPSVLVLFDGSDIEGAAEVERRIRDKGLSVWSAEKYLSGDPSKLTGVQNEYLRHCDAVVIYWNKSPDFWARITMQKLEKIFGDGREDPFVGQSIFVAGNNAVADIEGDTEADCLSSFEDLDVFLDDIKATLGRGGQK